MYKTTVVLYDDVKTLKTNDKVRIFFNNNFLCIEEGENFIFMVRGDRVESVIVNAVIEETEEPTVINQMITINTDKLAKDVTREINEKMKVIGSSIAMGL